MKKKNTIVLERNKIARRVMAEYDIPVIDLYNVVKPELETLSIGKGNVHYKKEGYERMAEQTGSKISEMLKTNGDLGRGSNIMNRKFK